MDKMDLEILALLDEDARRPLQGIAKKLKVSEGTIRNRVSKLEKEKVIIKYAATLEPRKLEFNATAIIALNVEPANFLSVVKALSAMNEVRMLITCTGDESILFEVWKKDTAQMTNFLETNIKPLLGITKISTHFIVERVKTSGGPLTE